MNKPYIIGISGGSGSGKTTFLSGIQEQFAEHEICVISQDNYYKPREEQVEDDNGVIDFDKPSCIDRKSFYKDIKKLSKGEEVRYLEYTFNNAVKEAQEIVLKPAPIIIVEGLFVFHYKKVMNLLDLKVFVHAEDVLKIIRRIQRDRIERNYPLDDVLYRYRKHILPAFEKYILPYRDSADLVINNNEHFNNGLEVFRGFLKNKLIELKKEG